MSRALISVRTSIVPAALLCQSTFLATRLSWIRCLPLILFRFPGPPAPVTSTVCCVPDTAPTRFVCLSPPPADADTTGPPVAGTLTGATTTAAPPEADGAFRGTPPAPEN